MKESNLVRGFVLRDEAGTHYLDRHRVWMCDKFSGPSSAWVHLPHTLELTLTQSFGWESEPHRLYAAIYVPDHGPVLISSKEISKCRGQALIALELWLTSQLLETKKPGWEFPEESRVVRYGVTIRAIDEYLSGVRQDISGMSANIRNVAARTLCNKVDELSRFGAKVQWT